MIFFFAGRLHGNTSQWQDCNFTATLLQPGALTRGMRIFEVSPTCLKISLTFSVDLNSLSSPDSFGSVHAFITKRFQDQTTQISRSGAFNCIAMQIGRLEG